MFTLYFFICRLEVFITIYNEIITGQCNIKTQIENLQKKIAALPEGKLLCVRNGNYVKWFLSNGKNPIYLPKKKRSLAESLALKKFYQLQLKELTIKQELLETQLQEYQNSNTEAMILLDTNSCFRELLEPHFRTFSKEIQEWADEDYEHNPNHPEFLTHKTFSKYKVRSKSEVIIANTLFSNQIPFRYECVLTLQNINFYPDFTIRHPKTGETIYWEHFGMMDNPSYCSKTFNKLNIYAEHGLIPTINLITTYETRTSPINSEKIRQIVHEYFL